MEKNRKKVSLALSIISGRASIKFLDSEEWDLLGCDFYRFHGMGLPDEDNVKVKAEEIILDAIFAPPIYKENEDDR